MNFSDYLNSKRSGNNQIKLSQIPTTSKILKIEPEIKKIPSEVKKIPAEIKKIPREMKNPSEAQKRFPSTGGIFNKFIKPDEKTNDEPLPVNSDADDDSPTQKSPPKTFLVKPSDIITTKRRYESKKKFFKTPENLKDIRKHGDHKPRGGSKVIGTKVPKKPQAAVLGPLTGQTFVITGLLKDYERDELTEILKKFGARVTGSVSKKTSCLIHGNKLEDGRHYSEGNKYKKSKELNTTIIDEVQLEEMLIFLMGGKKKETIDDPATVPPNLPPAPVYTQLWVEKYKPKKLRDIVGNIQAVEKLVKWLEDWESVVLGGFQKEIRPVRNGRFDPTLNVNAVSVLISGPPGVGKTTAARLVSLGLNYKITELNASDTRSRKSILEPLLSTSNSSCLTETAQVVRSILIMDEIDGMCAGDRGGLAALIQVIKQTRIPIICICNDRISPRMKCIGNHSYDIKFSKPNKIQVTSRMLEILNKEGIEVDPAAVEQLVESSGCDIRQCLTILEMWARQSNVVTSAMGKQGLKIMSKDPLSMVGNFDAAGRLLNKKELRGLRYRERIDLFFIDFDIIPLIIHENYLQAMTNDPNQLKRLSLAADSICLGDVINTFMRREKEWSLLQQYAQVSAIEPGLRSGNGITFPKFPEWFGKFNIQKKNSRLLREVRNSIARHISGEDESILKDYVPTLYKLIMTPLKKGKIQETVEIMSSYKINPEMLKEHLIQLQFGSTTCEEEFRNVPNKDKCALTKLYNIMYKSSIEKIRKKREKDFKDKIDPEYVDEEEKDSESEESEEQVHPKPKAKAKK
jgi:replication factor C subunit 1